MTKHAILALAAFALLGSPALADGFHSPLLRNKDPKKWGETTRENLGLDKSDTAEEEDGGGDSFRRRGAAGQLVEVLKYLDRKNVLLREFPDFNYEAIPEFKSQTEAILIAIGKDAVPLLVDTIIADLKGETGIQGLQRVADLRERVIRILIAIGPDSLDTVMSHLADPEADVRNTMLRIVRGIVTEPDFGTRAELWIRWHRIYRAGARRDQKAVPELLKALSDSDRRIRQAAVSALGEIQSRAAVPELMKLLTSTTDPALLSNLCRALAKIGDRKATPKLIDLLEHSQSSVRAEAATALRFLTRAMNGFDAQDPKEKREAAIQKWRKWWERELLRQMPK